MATKTTHVIPARGRWIVKKSGMKAEGVFASQKEATAEAKRLIKGKAGQVVVHTKNGNILSAEMHGLPKVQRAAVRSKLGSKAIEKAVSKVVQARITSA
jgi:hypothetical protein